MLFGAFHDTQRTKDFNLSGILAFALPVPAIIARFQKKQEASSNARRVFQFFQNIAKFCEH